MLTVPAAPFDSPEYSFELKWNGIRALAAVESAGWRLWGRQRADYLTAIRSWTFSAACPQEGWSMASWSRSTLTVVPIWRGCSAGTA
jgi:hypothetical protein